MLEANDGIKTAAGRSPLSRPWWDTQSFAHGVGDNLVITWVFETLFQANPKFCF
jgi:hypothetical protein